LFAAENQVNLVLIGSPNYNSYATYTGDLTIEKITNWLTSKPTLIDSDAQIQNIKVIDMGSVMELKQESDS
jgi:hypothetical protein